MNGTLPGAMDGSASRSTIDLILREHFVVIARNIEPKDMAEFAEALFEGGVLLLEVTFAQDRDDRIGRTGAAISSICARMGSRMRIGAGTVLSLDEVRAAKDSGATYIISPGTKASIIEETKRLGMVSIPGAMTPSEIVHAWDSGADIVKLFPADDLGYHYIRNVRAPLPHIPLMATGGVNPETIPEFLAAGIAAVATGVTVFKPDLVARRDYAAVTALARLHVEAVRRFTGKGA